MKYLVFLYGMVLSGQLLAVDIDQLFEAQNKPIGKSVSVSQEVYESTEDSTRAVRRKVEEVNEQRRQMSRAAEPTVAPERARNGWQIVKTYEGGFVEFGADKSRTIYVVRCGSGAEHKMYSDDRNKWGTTGLGGNHAFATLEEAASKKCN